MATPFTSKDLDLWYRLKRNPQSPGQPKPTEWTRVQAMETEGLWIANRFYAWDQIRSKWETTADPIQFAKQPPTI